MGYRRFVDRQGRVWEIHERARNEWEFVPGPGNAEVRRTLSPPGYENDPFEMSDQEIQRLLDSDDGPARRRPAKNPFGD